jgi:hypothetical protein
LPTLIRAVSFVTSIRFLMRIFFRVLEPLANVLMELLRRKRRTALKARPDMINDLILFK